MMYKQFYAKAEIVRVNKSSEAAGPEMKCYSEIIPLRWTKLLHLCGEMTKSANLGSHASGTHWPSKYWDGIHLLP